MSDNNPLEAVIRQFAAAPRQLRLELLLEFSRKVKPLPERYRDSGNMERVHECQTPFFLATEQDGDGVRLFFDAPEDAPTTRGFAGVLSEGLDGRTKEEILATPDDFPDRMGISELISPLRLRGMSGILNRIKRQVAEL